MPIRRLQRALVPSGLLEAARVAACAVPIGFAAVITGCTAEPTRRQALERVAKDWCETIRASQVMPVYPLTEDLRPGDLFFVQTTLANESRQWRERGYLALDNFVTRLEGIDYKQIYFDGYFEDDFADQPNTRPSRTGGAVGQNQSVSLSEANAPRAAFPTYTFEVKTSQGLNLAIPIQGVPIGLNLIRADAAKGSVTIADARTYSCNPVQAVAELREWYYDPANDEMRFQLDQVVRRSAGPVYIRLVTRVYLTGGVVVSLAKSEAAGGELRGGVAPTVSLMKADGSPNENYQALLNLLNQRADPVTDLSKAGGAVKFVEVSDRTVSLAESFDRLLVIGYLGLDIPVLRNGELGAPVPTFQRLDNGSTAVAATRGSKLTSEQQQFKMDQRLLRDLGGRDQTKAIQVMRYVSSELGVRAFSKSSSAISEAEANPSDVDLFGRAVDAFYEDSVDYLGENGSSGPRYDRYRWVIFKAFGVFDK